MTTALERNMHFVGTSKQPRIAIALWDYKSQEDNELSFVAGDRIIIKEFCNEDWYEGSLNGVTAYFPANHVRVLPEIPVAPILGQNGRDESSAHSSFSSGSRQPYEPASIGNAKEEKVHPSSTHHRVNTNTSLNSKAVVVTAPVPAVVPSQLPIITSESFSKQTALKTTISKTENQSSYADPSFLGTPESVETQTKLSLAPSDSLQDLYGNAVSAAELCVDAANDEVDTARSSEVILNTGSDEYIADNDWQVVTSEDGTVYYWNCATGETSWDPPYGQTILNSIDQLNIQIESPVSVTCYSPIKDSPVSPTSKAAGYSLRMKNGSSPIGTIEYVPSELIRREGVILYKIKKEFGGVEPKKAHSWHTAWVIVVLGFLIFYKDDPAKLRKKGEKVVHPLFVIHLEHINIKKEAKESTKKRAGFSIETRSGGLWLLVPPTEQEISEWMTTVEEATKESSSESEYENAVSKLYAPPPSPPEIEPSQIRKEKKNSASKSSKGDGLDDEEPSKGTIKSKLNNFFKRTNEKGSDKPLMDKDSTTALSLPPYAIFGGSIPAQIEHDKSNIPSFVKSCITEVDSKGLLSQGIYRLSGNAATIQRIKTAANETLSADGLFDDTVDVNVIAGLLKLYLRELADPVIPFEFYDRFISAMKLEEYNDRLIEIKNLVQMLPKPHYDLLEYLIRHLKRVASHSDVNKMEPSNLAIVFGPSIIRIRSTGNDDMGAAYANMINMSYQNSLIEAIIIQTDWLFDGSPN